MNLETGIRTICALSSAPGHGGISVVRVSGPDSETVVRAVCPFIPERIESHRVYFGRMMFPKTDEMVDEVVVTHFEKGRSFTGEQTFEISCHGNPIVVDEIQNSLISAGAKMAEPGEFTFQAFFNGRLDLVQAESVLSLIESQNKWAKKISLSQLTGKLSNLFNEFEDTLTWCLAQQEASIDFSEENLDIADLNAVKNKLRAMDQKVSELIETYKFGQTVRDGLKVCLVGTPNVGKSSVFNALLEFDRSIVTETAGTTRDWVSEKLMLNGSIVELLDTAGLREAADQVEQMGVARTKQMIDQSAVLVWIVDLTRPLQKQDLTPFTDWKDQAVFVFANKADLLPAQTSGERESALDLRRHWMKQIETLDPQLALKLQDAFEKHFVVGSAMTKHGLSALKESLTKYFSETLLETDVAITQARQHEDLLHMQVGLRDALKELDAHTVSPDFVSLGLQKAQLHLYRILGKQVEEQVIDRIFAEFCLGK